MEAYIKDGKFSPEFDALFLKDLDRWNIPGASIAVIQDDAVISKGYGFSRLPDVPVESTTLFNCASMTKAFTAAAVSLLVDDNKKFPDVQWETPVSSLIRDDFVLSDSRYTEQVTVEDILSHRSGLPDHDNACLGTRAKVPDTPKSVIRKLRNLPLSQPLRTKYLYSNVMYTAAAHLVETLTGQWFGQFLSEKLWAPLGMSHTYYGMDDVRKHQVIENLARAYGWDEERKEYFDIPWCDQPEGSGSGEMISNVLDYAEFLKCMIHKTGPISEKGHEELVKPRIWTGDKLRPFMSYQFYGFGWAIDTYHGELVINHDGGVDGFSCKMIYLPRLKWGVVMFGNCSHSYKLHEKICWTLIDKLLGIPEEKRFNCEEDEDDEPDRTKESLYPGLRETPLPLTLPLASYTGEYKHLGYGIMDIKLKEGNLSIDCTDRSWPFIMTLEHVSGEFFMAKIYEVDSRNTGNRKAQFQIGPNGCVMAFGVDLTDGMEGEMLWFQKVES